MTPRPAVTRAAILAAALAAGGCHIEKAGEAERGMDLATFATRMLVSASAAWNAGDLEAWLSSYLPSESTTYAESGGILVGFEEIRTHLSRHFKPGARRDSVRFESIRTRRLGALYGLITGRRILHGAGHPVRSGPFTLVVRRVGGGWKIIHDHSLVDSSPAQDVPASDLGIGP